MAREIHPLVKAHLENSPKTCSPKSHFLDSGAFSLWRIALKYHQDNAGSDRWAYYYTKEFKRYLKEYADFVKKYHHAIDLYANVDVIPNPELTWRNQQILENRFGLKPVPVVHFGTNLTWLDHYIKLGYELIGLGGLVGNINKKPCQDWVHACFDRICDKSGKPKIKIHGFGISNIDCFTMFPWHSVDSATWTKNGMWGTVLFPSKKNGKFNFFRPYKITVSEECGQNDKGSKHLYSLSPMEKGILDEWLNIINIPLGSMQQKESYDLDTVAKKDWVKLGLVNHHSFRREANLWFFHYLEEEINKNPVSYKRKKMIGGLL
jgi:hypothetical protein